MFDLYNRIEHTTIQAMGTSPHTLRPRTRFRPQLQAPAQLTPLQAKEKDYHNAQSEQVDTTLALFIGAGKSAGESKFAALENMDTVRINR